MLQNKSQTIYFQILRAAKGPEHAALKVRHSRVSVLPALTGTAEDAADAVQCSLLSLQHEDKPKKKRME